MPFTGSHPAAVLPLLRRGHWVSAALLTGSIAPDLPSYVPLGLDHTQTHLLSAIGWPDFPIAACFLLLWWMLLRPGLLPLIPAAVCRQLGEPGWRSRRDPVIAWLGWVVLSLAVGLATHLLWDSFTHSDGAAVTRWAPLSDVLAHRPLYVWLQLISSVGGLGVLAAWVRSDWRRTAAASQPRPGPVVAAPGGLILTVWALLAVLAVTAAYSWERFEDSRGLVLGRLDAIGFAIKGAGGAILIGLTLWSLGWLVAQRPARTGERRPHRSAGPHVP